MNKLFKKNNLALSPCNISPFFSKIYFYHSKFFYLFLILLLNSNFLYSQEKFVAGKVTSHEDGSEMIGVNVIIKGTTVGVITDLEGNYSISVPSNESVLLFSFIGYEQQEITVGNRTKIDVVLKTDEVLLDDILVIGYGVQKKSIATASVSKVESEALQGFSVARVDQALQGQVAGVTFKSSSGQPGASQNIFIRGVGTNGDNNPLTIVDGVAFNDTGILSTLNPNDIESIQVLKDGASTAIYGTRAANGLIVVTTKKGGVKGKVNMSYDFNYGNSQAWRVPEMMNSRQYVDIIKEKYGKTTLPTYFPQTEEDILFNTNWMDQIFETGTTQTHQFSVSRGGDNGNLFTSFSYFDQKGIIAPDKSNQERLTLRLNSDSKINDYLTFGQNLFLIYNTKNAIPDNNAFGSIIGDALVYDPITPAYDENSLYGFAQSPFVQKEHINPLSRLFINNDETKSHGAKGNFYLKAKPIEGLELTSDVGFDYNVFSQRTFQPTFQFKDIYLNSLAFAANPLNDISVNSNNTFSWQWENFATYRKSFGKHNFEFTAGMTVQERFASGFGASSQGINEDVQFDENFWFISQTPDSLKRSYSYENERQGIYSNFGRVVYNYDEKYLLTLILRRDGSTQFGENNRFGTFPSASVGWVVSNENFWPENPVNFLKLRASYGVNGNDRIKSLRYVSTIEFSGDYQFGKPDNQVVINGQSPLISVNPDMKWEQSKHIDIGLEAGFFDDQLTLEFDYFHKTTSDLLMPNTLLPITAGFNPSEANVGEVINKGIELELNYRKNIGDLKLNIGFNASTLNNEVVKVGSSGVPIQGYTWLVRNTIITRMEVGKPIGYFRGFKTLGIFRTQDDVYSHINSEGDLLQPFAKPGDLIFSDENGDGTIDVDGDMVEIGKPWSDLMLGLNIGLNYKQFDFRVLFSASVGNDIFRSYERSDVQNNNYTTEWLDRWSEDNPNGKYPKIADTGNDNNNTNIRPSSFYVEDADYLRIRNLQIGYSLPQKILNKAKISRFRVYLAFDNLLTVTGYTGFDPEIGTSEWILDTGIDKGFYPQSRTTSIGINFSL